MDTGKENVSSILDSTRRLGDLRSDDKEDNERTVKFVSMNGYSSRRKKCFDEDDNKSVENVNVIIHQKQ